MKKILTVLTILTFVLVSTLSYSQTNVQVHYELSNTRNYVTTTLESFKIDDIGSMYFFADLNSNSELTTGYVELAREFTFWKAPIFAHVEYNGGMEIDGSIINGNELDYPYRHQFLLGATYLYEKNNFNITFSPLYKHFLNSETPHNFQLTSVWNYSIGKFDFNGFVDFWSEGGGKDFVFLAEPVLWYNLNKSIAIGSELEINKFYFVDNVNFLPTIALKYTL